MITQIEIDGFKTFKDFKVELAPFQVIVGANGSGKSNFFDALELLSKLAEYDLLTAFQGLRGDSEELFTKFPDGQTAHKLRFAVEILVDKKVKDNWGLTASIKDTRLRYELEIAQYVDDNGLEELRITHEALRSLPASRDEWCRKYHITNQTEKWEYFILPSNEASITVTWAIEDALEQTTKPTIELSEDEGSREKVFVMDDLKATVLSNVKDDLYPHAFAARQELLSLRFLHLNPDVLRQPGAVKAPRTLLADGGNLPTTLARIRAEDSTAFHFISLDMASLVPGLLNIEVERDKPTDRYVIYATTTDGRRFSAQVLSDGTLRLLALATLRNDPSFHGIVCIEEPENGVQPLYINKIAQLLRDMATDFSDSEQADEPLRQVLVTTHSPLFASQREVIDSLLLTTTPVLVQGKQTPALRVTRMHPVITPQQSDENDKGTAAYTIDMMQKYLDSNVLDEALKTLKNARTQLDKEQV